MTQHASDALPPERCVNCRYGNTVKQDLTVVQCGGLPPVPVVVGMSPQGPAISLIYPNLPRSTKACALWKATQAIIAANG